MYWFMYWLYNYASKVGMFLVVFPLAYDIFYRGGRELALISVGTIGAWVQIAGLILIALSRYAGTRIDEITQP